MRLMRFDYWKFIYFYFNPQNQLLNHKSFLIILFYFLVDIVPIFLNVLLYFFLCLCDTLYYDHTLLQWSGTDPAIFPRYACISTFIAALFTITKEWEPLKGPATEWMNRTWYIIYWNIIQTLKGRKFWHMLHYRSTLDIMLSEISQSQKDKYCMIPLLWGSWKNQIHRDGE